jgi:PadR family transcriptional regulator, regulatory protein PadR
VTARFDLAPPRHFLLPAVLLLVAEQPSHGYQLVKELAGMPFGPADRPAVYRALAQLEADGLVEAWSDAPVAGSMRRVYGMTDHGGRVLRTWMGVVQEERDALDRVLRRYSAGGSADAMLAEVAGGMAAAGGPAFTAVSAAADTRRPPAPERRARPIDLRPPSAGAGRQRFELVDERSAVLVEARSTVGPISFGALGVSGWMEAEVVDGAVVVDRQAPSANLVVPVGDLRSGNRFYDAELLRRIDASRHPTVTLQLDECTPLGMADRYRVRGGATLHGVSRALEGSVVVQVGPGGGLEVTGEQVLDIRDFDIDSPTVLMLRIYPDVTVRLQIEATPLSNLELEEVPV